MSVSVFGIISLQKKRGKCKLRSNAGRKEGKLSTKKVEGRSVRQKGERKERKERS